MTHLGFVTGNAGKVAEISAALGRPIRQLETGYPEIQADSLEEVAAAGVEWLLANGTEPPFFVEDSGLFVHALAGFPGVYSRFALDTLGVAGMLRLMAPMELENRTAHFETVIAYADGASIRTFSGRCAGTIAEKARGTHGFGFDPIFVPQEGNGETFAEMASAAKTALSHRGKATARFRAALNKEAKP